MINCFYLRADTKRINGQEHFRYSDILMLKRFGVDCFLLAIERGHVLIDFDARTGHNHGTKFRLRQNYLAELYEEVVQL